MKTETKTQHTPGPWEIDCRDNEAPCVIREPAKPAGSLDEWLAVATLHGPSPIRESNARLIAAAPELLAACEMLLRYDATVPIGPTGEIADGQKLVDAIRLASAAIAKAKGIAA